MKKKVIILGSVSFLLDHAKVGINWIAEYLASNGYDVTYVSSPSTVLDFLFKHKRERFFAAWIRGGRYEIAENLHEVIFKSPWILNRLSSKFFHKTATFFERNLLNDEYDVLISTVGALALFVEYIKAEKKILRLQDSPINFGLSNYNVAHIEKLLHQNIFSQIWSVSNQLYQYSEKLTNARNYYIPNGVNLNSFRGKISQCQDKKAIYFGVFSDWVDVNLIINTANILTDWSFDLYGDRFFIHNLPNNVKYCGAVRNEQIPDLLINYSVGLIPFKDCEHIKVVERPLKFYQYLASRLGIASVSYGSLQKGMGNFAKYGNTPNDFAMAINDAYLVRDSYNEDNIGILFAVCSWESVLPKIFNLINS